MESKPDIIRTLLLVFALGLVVTGLTSFQATADDGRDAAALDGFFAASGQLSSARDD